MDNKKKDRTMKSKSITLMLMITLPILASAQMLESLSPTIVDARSSAMGRTAIVSASGSNGMFSNPAVLATLNNKSIQVGARMNMGSRELGWLEDSDINYEYTMPPHFSLNHFSYSMPYTLPGSNLLLAVGVGFRTYFDLGMNTSIDASDNGEKYEEETTTNGGLKVITPTIAMNYNDKYYVGATFNKSILSKEKYEYEDSDDYTYETEQEYSASFLKFGGFVKINPQISIGFSYTPEFELKEEKWKWKNNDGGSNSGNGDDYTIPSVLGLGASYQVSPTLVIVGEYQNRKFSDLEYDGDDFDMNDGNCLRIGAEYKGPIILRAGFFSDATLATDDNDDDPLSLIGFTGGFGYNFGGVFLDLFAEYSSISIDDDTYTDVITMFRFGVTANYTLNK